MWVGYFLFFNFSASTEIYTLSLHDALPISRPDHLVVDGVGRHLAGELTRGGAPHAVRHDEQRPALPDLVLAHRWLERRLAAREIRHEKAVLVMVARLAEIGLGADLDLDGFG